MERARDVGKRRCLTGCPDPNTELARDWSVVVRSWHGLPRQLFGNDGSPREGRREGAGPRQQYRISVKFCCPGPFSKRSSESRKNGNEAAAANQQKETNKATNGGLVLMRCLC